jgi:hypothetical protein
MKLLAFIILIVCITTILSAFDVKFSDYGMYVIWLIIMVVFYLVLPSYTENIFP